MNHIRKKDFTKKFFILKIFFLKSFSRIWFISLYFKKNLSILYPTKQSLRHQVLEAEAIRVEAETIPKLAIPHPSLKLKSQ